MAEYGHDVLWYVEDAVGPVDLDDLSLSDELRASLINWAEWYDGTLNHDYPPESGFASKTEADDFETEGLRIWKELRLELGPAYSISYFSTSDGRPIAEP